MKYPTYKIVQNESGERILQEMNEENSCDQPRKRLGCGCYIMGMKQHVANAWKFCPVCGKDSRCPSDQPFVCASCGAAEASEEKEFIEIPAFLRRQAN